jgi:hypothetical protein
MPTSLRIVRDKIGGTSKKCKTRGDSYSGPNLYKPSRVTFPLHFFNFLSRGTYYQSQKNIPVTPMNLEQPVNIFTLSVKNHIIC